MLIAFWLVVLVSAVKEGNVDEGQAIALVQEAVRKEWGGGGMVLDGRECQSPSNSVVSSTLRASASVLIASRLGLAPPVSIRDMYVRANPQ